MTLDKPCKLSPYANPGDGYARCHPDTHRGYRYHHRYIYAMYHNVDLKPHEHVMHTCDVRNCIEITHLELGNNALNMKDKALKGRAAMKLSEEDIDSIHDQHLLGVSQTEIAKEYSIHTSLVSRILSKERWIYHPR